MTLIATFKPYGVPVLIGDVLLTISDGEPRDGKQIVLPTRDDLNEFIPRVTTINFTGMTQKIYRINSNFVIGWTGSRLSAQYLVNDLNTLALEKPVTIKEVEKFLTSKEADPLTCTIIGWIVENNQAISFRWNNTCPTKFSKGRNFVEGSGRRRFLDTIRTQANPHQNPKKSILSTMTGLLASENIYGDNLRSGFGGMYQILVLEKSGFEFLSSITLMVMQIEEIGDKLNFIDTSLFVKTQQHEERLWVYRTYSKEGGILASSGENLVTHKMNNPKQVRDRALFIVSSINNTNESPSDIKQPKGILDLTSKFYSLCFVVKTQTFLVIDGKKIPIILPIVYSASQLEQQDYFDISEKKISINSILLQEIYTTIQTIDRNKLQEICRNIYIQ